ncbi:unnamed protein product [Vitrella brassicaformis CCMP3155]|uniref:Uncharacterized protein n=1 Tax=Vitrella brassicaformis (strain CCMP3155) TaxID=1169540 RepID=A0A0G4GHW0_VITBC|nr:unnamed protein product [Vitrella brassicaformis CCMP3155]|eukprot:CEM29308.1 unnamed protein product [Vitrella brassicaformis CCMP3155]
MLEYMAKSLACKLVLDIGCWTNWVQHDNWLKQQLRQVGGDLLGRRVADILEDMGFDCEFTHYGIELKL